jgi:hypothetical protein
MVLDEQRTTALKSAQPGNTKVSYGEHEDAVKWLWKFIDGAKSAGTLSSAGRELRSVGT